jgi:hypothetical protein
VPVTERLGGFTTVKPVVAFEPPGLEVTESEIGPFPVVGLTDMVIVKVVWSPWWYCAAFVSVHVSVLPATAHP